MYQYFIKHSSTAIAFSNVLIVNNEKKRPQNVF